VIDGAASIYDEDDFVNAWIEFIKPSAHASVSRLTKKMLLYVNSFDTDLKERPKKFQRVM